MPYRYEAFTPDYNAMVSGSVIFDRSKKMYVVTSNIAKQTKGKASLLLAFKDLALIGTTTEQGTRGKLKAWAKKHGFKFRTVQK